MYGSSHTLIFVLELLNKHHPQRSYYYYLRLEREVDNGDTAAYFTGLDLLCVFRPWALY